MARQSQNKSLNSSFVIVCEGTETENKYLEKLANDSTFECRVVPQPHEIVNKNAKKNRQKKNERQLGKGDDNTYTGPEYYIGLPEIDQKKYNEYCSEPRRWVRATQLFMERYGFAEGWAVYDLDDQSGRNKQRHQKAREDAKKVKNLHIAFSSYSIEEWFLLHFERNKQAFEHSECKYKNNRNKKVNVECGDANCTHKDNCYGVKCLAGYLREKGYIKDYSKDKGDKYVDITKNNLHKACVNAAWSRSLNHNAQPYECNPYTDIDKLILRLLGTEIDVCWINIDEEFNISSSKLIICREGQQIKLKCLKGSFLGTTNSLYWCNDDYQKTTSAINIKKICDEQNSIDIVNKPIGNDILCIKSGNKEFYLEI